jgi:hypothetical protein
MARSRATGMGIHRQGGSRRQHDGCGWTAERETAARQLVLDFLLRADGFVGIVARAAFQAVVDAELAG